MDKEIKQITEFISKQVGEARADGVVIGISGGLDSAVVATLAVKALGKENVHGLFMPSNTTPQADWDDVSKIAELLGITLEVADIDDIVSLFNVCDIRARANVKARVRMTMLYAEANIANYLVLGTSDKSELAIGYFTKWGDGAADIQPIINLYKTEVKKIAKALGVPKSIIKKPSSPALVHGQTAEDELGFGYDEIDRMLQGEIPMHSHITRLMAGAVHKQKPAPRLYPWS